LQPQQCLLKLYLWAANRLYNEFAWAYEVVCSLVSLGRWNSWRLLALNHVIGPRILEIGFGTGELLAKMAEQGFEVYGLDISKPMHSIAHGKLRRRCLAVPRVLADARRMPFRSKSFDTVVATFPAPYVFSPLTLSEVARLLRPSNTLVGPHTGRFVVVGLAVEMNDPALRRATQFIFSRSCEDNLAKFAHLASVAGFDTQVTWHREKSILLPILVLTKQNDPSA